MSQLIVHFYFYYFFILFLLFLFDQGTVKTAKVGRVVVGQCELPNMRFVFYACLCGLCGLCAGGNDYGSHVCPCGEEMCGRNMYIKL